MIRQISPGPSLVPDSAPVAEPVTTLPASPAPAVVPAESRDALAGALPAWDLLPASPFIRRIK